MKASTMNGDNSAWFWGDTTTSVPNSWRKEGKKRSRRKNAGNDKKRVEIPSSLPQKDVFYLPISKEREMSGPNLQVILKTVINVVRERLVSHHGFGGGEDGFVRKSPRHGKDRETEREIRAR